MLKVQPFVNKKALNSFQEEKRFFQMELVNRETNFNKVFNGDPKVGVLNPLTVAKVRNVVD